MTPSHVLSSLSSIGSNIFDVLVGLPLPWICFNLIMGENVEVRAESLGLSIVILIFMLICVVTLVMCSGWKITKTLGYSMFLLYGEQRTSFVIHATRV